MSEKGWKEMLYPVIKRNKLTPWYGAWMHTKYGLQYAGYRVTLFEVVIAMLKKLPYVLGQLRILEGNNGKYKGEVYDL